MSGSGGRSGLAPDPPRRLRHGRALNVACRTVHIAAFGTLLGGHVFAVEPERLVPALALAVASGVALAALELYQTARWLLTLKGAVVVAKLALLACVPLFWEARVPILLAVVAVASAGAHAPARVRHYPLFGARRGNPAAGLDPEVRGRLTPPAGGHS